MKFLKKYDDSIILKRDLKYQKNNAGNNKMLKLQLIKEQRNFCAYTEKYLQGLDASEVEHFNSKLKYNDDYYNYYAVIRRANLYKKDEQYKNAGFFKTLFFQQEAVFNARVKYEDGIYSEVDKSDDEARDLIDFLGFNHPYLYEQRKRHVKRLKKTFDDAGYTKQQCFEYFKEHKEDLSFITAIEKEMNVDLRKLIEL